MVQLGEAFDPRSTAPSTGAAGQLPVSGKEGLLVHIIDSEMKETNAGDGSYLDLTLECLDEEHKGVNGSFKLNLGNVNAQAVQIAYRDLSAICHVIGHLEPLQDVSVLYNRPFRVITQLQSGTEGREKGYTEVKRFLDTAGNKPGQQQSGGGPSPGPAPSPAAPTPAPAAPAAPAQQWSQPSQPTPEQQWAQQQPQAPQQPQQQAPQVDSGVPQPQWGAPPQTQQPPAQPTQQQPPPAPANTAPNPAFPPQSPPAAPNPAAAPWNQAPGQ